MIEEKNEEQSNEAQNREAVQAMERGNESANFQTVEVQKFMRKDQLRC